MPIFMTSFIAKDQNYRKISQKTAMPASVWCSVRVRSSKYIIREPLMFAQLPLSNHLEVSSVWTNAFDRFIDDTTLLA